MRANAYGADTIVPGPFGAHPRRYFDYAASGLPFRPIERVLAEDVLPFMSSTHSASSYSAEVIHTLVEAAREKIRRAVGGTRDDVIVYTGAGATSAVNHLVRCLGMRIPEPLASTVPPEQRPLVILSRMEHHANELPWRESIAEIEYVGYDEHGRANWRDIDRLLSAPDHRDRPLKIGAFTAASSVTGVLNDTNELAAAMHDHGGLAFFDVAAAGPYIPIDLHPGDEPRYQKDAIFLSMHELMGGPQSPGVLIANKSVLARGGPAEAGDESGTPPIVGAIRAGLAFDLKAALGQRSHDLAEHCVRTAVRAWRTNPKVRVLGPDPETVPRLGILSLILDHGRLHHNLAVRLLNDLYGIQVRGGWMFAGTYGHDLLAIDKPSSQSVRATVDDGNLATKPGWVRVSFGPCVKPLDLEVLIQAIPFVAEHWRELYPSYVLDERTAEWRHRSDVAPVPELRLPVPSVKL